MNTETNRMEEKSFDDYIVITERSPRSGSEYHRVVCPEGHTVALIRLSDHGGYGATGTTHSLITCNDVELQQHVDAQDDALCSVDDVAVFFEPDLCVDFFVPLCEAREILQRCIESCIEYCHACAFSDEWL